MGVRIRQKTDGTKFLASRLVKTRIVPFAARMTLGVLSSQLLNSSNPGIDDDKVREEGGLCRSRESRFVSPDGMLMWVGVFPIC